LGAVKRAVEEPGAADALSKRLREELDWNAVAHRYLEKVLVD
jgi:hypothetical protein